MSDDIYRIVERLAILEGRITPATVKHGLNKQQQSVKQLPALFKPHDISPTLSKKPYQKHPMDGWLVGEDTAMEGDVVSMSKAGWTNLTSKDDYLDKRDTIYRLLSQPGTDSATRDAAKQRLKDLDLAARNAGLVTQDDPHWNFGSDTIAEAQTTEEKLLDKVKKSFIDYLDSVEDRVKKDGELKDKNHDDGDLKAKDKRDRDLIAKIKEDPTGEEPSNTDLDPTQPVTDTTYSEPSPAPIKTMTMEDGRTCEIHGDEARGFGIKHGNRVLPSRFKNIQQAEMAFEMYCARARARALQADYLDEK